MASNDTEFTSYTGVRIRHIVKKWLKKRRSPANIKGSISGEVNVILEEKFMAECKK